MFNANVCKDIKVIILITVYLCIVVGLLFLNMYIKYVCKIPNPTIGIIVFLGLLFYNKVKYLAGGLCNE